MHINYNKAIKRNKKGQNMAFIEQIEKQSIKNLKKNLWFYLTILGFSAPLYFVNTDYSIAYLVLIAIIFAAIFIIDIKEYIIPDSSQIAIFILANGLIFTSEYRSFAESYAGFAFAGGMFALVYFIAEKYLGKEVLGFGDVKLFANVGLLIGFFSVNYFLWVLTLTSGSFVLLKILFGKKDKLIPYGPFIVISAWICLLYADYFEVLNHKIMTAIFS